MGNQPLEQQQKAWRPRDTKTQNQERSVKRLQCRQHLLILPWHQLAERGERHLAYPAVLNGAEKALGGWGLVEGGGGLAGWGGEVGGGGVGGRGGRVGVVGGRVGVVGRGGVLAK